MSFFLLFGRGRVVCFAVWAGAPAPPQHQKTNTPPLKQQKNKHAPAPSERFFFCYLGGWSFFLAVWAGGVLFFCCLGGVHVFFAVWAGAGGWGGGRVFLLFGRCACFFFCCLGGVVFFVLLFGRGGCICFCCLGGGVFFFCCLGGGREFTHLPVFLARLQATQQQKSPNSKKNTHTGSPPGAMLRAHAGQVGTQEG